MPHRFSGDLVLTMINYTVGNLLASDKEALVNTVNLEGFMGKGIAYQFKKQFPRNNEAYINACKNNEIGIGRLFLFKEGGKIIVNFPTKDKWREKTKVEYLERGLNSLKKIVLRNKIKSIAIPPLGCGNGGLSWGIVKPIIEEKLQAIQNEIDILIYEPSCDFCVKPKNAPRVTMSHLLTLGCMKNLNSLTSTTIQKALFFMCVFAKSNFFKFDEYKHGPYSHPIEIVVKQVTEYLEFYDFKSSARRDLSNALALMYNGMVSKAIDNESKHYAPYLKKACALCNEFLKGKNGIKNLEIAATIVHILIQNDPLGNDEILNSFLSYPKENMSIFSSNEILKGIEFLTNKNIIQKDVLGGYSVKNQ